MDQRGHGASERLPPDVSRSAYVADVVAVADRLGLESPVLVGQSLGGHTAVLTAARHPALVRALVLVEAGAGEPNPDAPARIGAWLDSWPVPFRSRDTAVRFFGGGPVGEGWADGLEERDGLLWPRFDRDVMVGSLAGKPGAPSPTSGERSPAPPCSSWPGPASSRPRRSVNCCGSAPT